MTLNGLFRRRRLPHWDVPDATYFVTPCLEGSLPARGLVELETFRDRLDERPRPLDMSKEEWEEHKHKLLFARFDQMIDTAPAVTYLANPQAAECVRKSLYHFAGQRYDLVAYAIMPSHYHWVFHPNPH